MIVMSIDLVQGEKVGKKKKKLPFFPLLGNSFSMSTFLTVEFRSSSKLTGLDRMIGPKKALAALSRIPLNMLK